MKSDAKTPETYLESLPEERKYAMNRLRNLILKNLPAGFKEQMTYGMLGYIVPHDLYPAGYHCTPEQPLPFINLASQKNFIAIHHLGLYANEQLSNWFKDEYPKHCTTKIDMGKGCIRLKKLNDIPYELIAELTTKYTVKEWIVLYEKSFKKT